MEKKLRVKQLDEKMTCPQKYFCEERLRFVLECYTVKGKRLNSDLYLLFSTAVSQRAYAIDLASTLYCKSGNLDNWTLDGWTVGQL